MKRTVLVVDDEQNMQAVMRMVLEESGYTVLTVGSPEAAAEHVRNPNLDVIVTDLKMPGIGGEAFVHRCRTERADVPVIIVTAHGTIRSAVQSIRDGAADYLAKPFEPEQLEMSVHNAVRLRDVLRENERLRATIDESRVGGRLIGSSAASRRLREEIARVAPFKTSVLITGESGTGKELVARAIHELSPRADGPWVAINCSAIPRDLMESELFGYVKGAFSGAAQNRAGRLDRAQGGTLFLDEIGELDPALQAKLLRVLQEREYSPLGADDVRAVDVRFIAASNRDIGALVEQGRFREDLFYRLNVYHIVVPPLRERSEDVPLLAQTFLNELAAEMNLHVARIAPAALEALAQYPWPGNVRELRNSLERALLSCRREVIEVGDLSDALTQRRSSPDGSPSCMPGAAGLDIWLEEIERRAILQALAQTRGVQAQAAKVLGVSERSLWHRVKKLGIHINRTAS